MGIFPLAKDFRRGKNTVVKFFRHQKQLRGKTVSPRPQLSEDERLYQEELAKLRQQPKENH